MSNELGVFETLSNINVNDKTEKKGNLTYLSWAWAWGELKKLYPDSTYKVYEHPITFNNYFDDKMTGWVKVGVTVCNIEHVEYLPILNYNNKSIPLSDITSFNVNTSIQRALTKAIARHGLGLYIYAGEDLPEGEEPKQEPKKDEAEHSANHCKSCNQEKPKPMLDKYNGYCVSCSKKENK